MLERLENVNGHTLLRTENTSFFHEHEYRSKLLRPLTHLESTPGLDRVYNSGFENHAARCAQAVEVNWYLLVSWPKLRLSQRWMCQETLHDEYRRQS